MRSHLHICNCRFDFRHVTGDATTSRGAFLVMSMLFDGAGAWVRGPFNESGPWQSRHSCPLRWQDVDFENLLLHIRRSVVAMVEGAPKTEASLKDVPLDAQTAESLWAWRRLSPHGGPSDWVFASPHTKADSRIGPVRCGDITASRLCSVPR